MQLGNFLTLAGQRQPEKFNVLDFPPSPRPIGTCHIDPLSLVDPLGLQGVPPMPRLPPRVVNHNSWNDPHSQLKKEYKNHMEETGRTWDSPMPMFPQPPKPWCTLVCPSDTPNSCPAPAPKGIPNIVRRVNNASRCVSMVRWLALRHPPPKLRQFRIPVGMQQLATGCASEGC